MEMARTFEEIDAGLVGPEKYARVTPSGIRQHASQLSRIVFRAAYYLAWLASRNTQVTFILMITASHNPPDDNGIKFSGSDGLPMEDQREEALLEEFINSEHPNKLAQTSEAGGCLFLGRDCRRSSPRLYGLARQAASYFSGVKIHELGQVSTPDIFSICMNVRKELNGLQKNMLAAELKEQYAVSTINNFKEAVSIVGWSAPKQRLLIDCANGVMGLLISRYKDMLEQYYELTIINSHDFDRPNEHCGSQFVQSHQCLPKGIESHLSFDKGVSFDGDGDRIILLQQGYYRSFQQKDNPKPKLMNGDRINLVIALAAKRLIQAIQKEHGIELRQGVCCSIIANLGFKKHVQQLGMPLRISGVNIKKVASKASEFDVASYFETSGHGSFYLSHLRYDELVSVKAPCPELRLLLCMFRLSCNNPKGDAFRNLLVLQLCQRYLAISNQQLFQIYQDFNIVSKKVEVANNLALATNSDETEIIEPASFALQLKDIKHKNEDCSIIVRSSTTEPVVRITLQGLRPQNELLGLAQQIADLIRNCKQLRESSPTI